MVKSKALMILAVLVLLFAAVSLSGCLGGDDDADNNTTDNNTTVPENNTTVPENNTTVPENNTTTNGSVTVVIGEDGPEPSYFVTIKDQKFNTASLSISKGETIRFMNTETRNFRHLYHSEDGAFEDFNLNPRYSATLTFDAAGTYKIDLLNYYTNESFNDAGSTLTVTVA
ncbi:hypothetical protein MmiHf6_02620 [Methanimicrococcus hongohii]|uniref:EfeO-type cupredoxin-like domain-containing protein n=1 Tax=Methanimicrococcus hongohii TaxID=3028295 RepID=A0AA96V0Y1_9EURY|nr:hypothetical protein [Methanimicrococcus sp. Hf6]WNY22968.1 hypothetical protein MmiHf6_02620 [Methanimicrococcus sp. Hf6]